MAAKCGYYWETSQFGSPDLKHWCGLGKGHAGGHECAVPGCGATT